MGRKIELQKAGFEEERKTDKVEKKHHQLPPPTVASPKVVITLLPLPHDCLRPPPPHLLHGGLRHRLRCHHRASQHRLIPWLPHRCRPPRRFPFQPYQRPIHHRGSLLRFYVRPRWHWHHPDGPRSRSKQGEEREGVVCLHWCGVDRDRVCYEYVLHLHYNPNLFSLIWLVIVGLTLWLDLWNQEFFFCMFFDLVAVTVRLWILWFGSSYEYI